MLFSADKGKNLVCIILVCVKKEISTGLMTIIADSAVYQQKAPLHNYNSA